MTPEQSIDLAGVARKHIHITGCDFPISLISIYAGLIHEIYPPIFIYVYQHYKFKCVYIPQVINNSKLIIRGKTLTNL